MENAAADAGWSERALLTVFVFTATIFFFVVRRQALDDCSHADCGIYSELVRRTDQAAHNEDFNDFGEDSSSGVVWEEHDYRTDEDGSADRFSVRLQEEPDHPSFRGVGPYNDDFCNGSQADCKDGSAVHATTTRTPAAPADCEAMTKVQAWLRDATNLAPCHHVTFGACASEADYWCDTDTDTDTSMLDPQEATEEEAPSTSQARTAASMVASGTRHQECNDAPPPPKQPHPARRQQHHVTNQEHGTVAGASQGACSGCGKHTASELCACGRRGCALKTTDGILLQAKQQIAHQRRAARYAAYRERERERDRERERITAL